VPGKEPSNINAGARDSPKAPGQNKSFTNTSPSGKPPEIKAIDKAFKSAMQFYVIHANHGMTKCLRARGLFALYIFLP